MEGEFLKVLDSYFENIAVQMGKEAQKVELEIEEDDPKVYKEMCGFAENIWNSCILDTKDWGQEKIYTMTIVEMCKAKVRLIMHDYMQEVGDE